MSSTAPHPSDGKRLVLDNQFPGIEQLGNAIVDGSSHALFPRYWQSLQSGQRVSFGSLALNPIGYALIGPRDILTISDAASPFDSLLHGLLKVDV